MCCDAIQHQASLYSIEYTIMTTHLMIIFLIGICFVVLCCAILLLLLFLYVICFALTEAGRARVHRRCMRKSVCQSGLLLYFVCLLHIHCHACQFTEIDLAFVWSTDMHQLSSYEKKSIFYHSPFPEKYATFQFHFDRRFRTVYLMFGGAIKIKLTVRSMT